MLISLYIASNLKTHVFHLYERYFIKVLATKSKCVSIVYQTGNTISGRLTGYNSTIKSYILIGENTFVSNILLSWTLFRLYVPRKMFLLVNIASGAITITAPERRKLIVRVGWIELQPEYTLAGCTLMVHSQRLIVAHIYQLGYIFQLLDNSLCDKDLGQPPMVATMRMIISLNY